MNAICNTCGRTIEVVTWSGRPTLVSHKTAAGAVEACEGSLEPVETHGRHYDGPTVIPKLGKIKGKRGSSIGEKIQKAKDKLGEGKGLNPKLGNSRLPNWYEREATRA